jgi:hypothetical protein
MYIRQSIHGPRFLREAIEGLDVEPMQMNAAFRANTEVSPEGFSQR